MGRANQKRRLGGSPGSEVWLGSRAAGSPWASGRLGRARERLREAKPGKAWLLLLRRWCEQPLSVSMASFFTLGFLGTSGWDILSLA